MSQFIANQWCVSAASDKTSINPADQSIVWQGSYASTDDIQQAVQAAEAALPMWRQLTVEGRLTHLQAYVEAIVKNADEIARIISAEMGKPLWESQQEVTLAKNKLKISVDAYHARTGYHETATQDGIQLLHHRPHGVVAILGPFNFPLHLPNGHLLPALLAGNTLVFKPSEYTPKTGELIAKCMAEANFPAGVFNLLQGDGTVAQHILQQPAIKGVYFTGSYKTGRAIHQFFGGRPDVILALEMGGNNPLIVTEVNDVRAASVMTIQSAFITSGQRCTCARRLIVIDNAKSRKFIETLIHDTSRLRVGAYDQTPQPFIGPLVNAHAASTVITHQKQLLQQGAKSLLEARLLEPNSAFVTPGIIDVTDCTALADEEIFAPFLHVVRVKDFNDALNVANQTGYGLSAGLISDNKNYFDHFERHVHAGVINWNKPTTGASSAMPFGGVGMSGNHRPSAFYAADYCAYPVVNSLAPTVAMPASLPPGMEIE